MMENKIKYLLLKNQIYYIAYISHLIQVKFHFIFQFNIHLIHIVFHAYYDMQQNKIIIITKNKYLTHSIFNAIFIAIFNSISNAIFTFNSILHAIQFDSILNSILIVTNCIKIVFCPFELY